ncbi:DNA adenine methylase [Prochlorothrix hollandica]|uniref:Site-specific DNA-methyltransferase (adenine-specific) n=1 Tax=Prochlorothrix hollandica PCC 9006 = CALU 1027 TaxID=317619 RepID=A0A0M2PQ62_PROHO|nr:DNA adenine methylase [Prochlorothrix hollandica]KKI98720.1 DNA methyltransferase [Prochlorothrix hollandica PCC 9006 = CALU 1027]
MAPRTKNKLVRPFLKWAGGKRQLITEITRYFPKGRFTYYEPFLGGGAVFLDTQFPQAIVNDKNAELINCYTVIRDRVEDLIEALKIHKEQHSETYYYDIREQDRHAQLYANLTAIERAARIIYLNKTCYNGLFRVNSQGQFNVPCGKYKNPSILDEGVLRAVSLYLSKHKAIKFLCGDFEEATQSAKKGDLIYFDPPYDPVSNTASFTGYDVNGFKRSQQKQLRDLANNLHKRGCRVMISNSATDFIKDLYSDPIYTIKIIKASRAINSNSLKRGKIDEVLIMNYSVQAG